MLETLWSQGLALTSSASFQGRGPPPLEASPLLLTGQQTLLCFLLAPLVTVLQLASHLEGAVCPQAGSACSGLGDTRLCTARPLQASG